MEKNKVLPIGTQGKTGLSPDAPMAITRGKIHSCLEHAISLLETEKAKMFYLGHWLGSLGNDGEIRLNQLAGITKAISILNAEKIKDIDLAEKKF